MRDEPKISVVVLGDKTKLLKDTLSDLINQSYRSLSICCQSSCGLKAKNILALKELGGKLDIQKIIKKVPKCDYCCFLRAGDRLEVDFFRQMLSCPGETSSLTIPNIIERGSDGDFGFLDFKKENIGFSKHNTKASFFKNAFRAYRLYAFRGSLISSNLFSSIVNSCELRNENSLLGLWLATTALLSAKTVKLCDEAYITIDKESAPLVFKNTDATLEDIEEVFSAILEENKKYQEDIIRWKNVLLSSATGSFGEKKDTEGDENYLLYAFNYRDSAVEYTDEFSAIATSIIESDIICFDVFDTLILRPFFEPKDLFKHLNKYATDILGTNSALRFSEIRVECEAACRDEAKKNGQDEITIEEIYDFISERYLVPRVAANKILEREIELELEFCRPRKFGVRMIELASYLKKRVVIASDMYLSRRTIVELLTKNGFHYDDIFVSSDELHTKRDGSMFKDILSAYPESTILHIDDNTHVCEVAESLGIKTVNISRTKDKFLESYHYILDRTANRLQREGAFLSDDSVKTSIAIIANRFFDEPYLLRNKKLGFCADPSEMGYFVLGMTLLSLSVWLLRNTKEHAIDSLVFLARDGYLPFEAARTLQDITTVNSETRLSYAYASRKAFLPLIFESGLGAMNLKAFVDWRNLSPRKLLSQFKHVLRDDLLDDSFANELHSNTKRYDDYEKYLRDLKVISEKLVDPAKYESYKATTKSYFEPFLGKKNAIFDIGYSARPEYLLNKLFGEEFFVYFYHTISSVGHEFSGECGNVLKKFLDYVPAGTGSLREVFFSSLEPGCVGYRQKGDKVKPILKKRNDVDLLTEAAINSAQKSALSFVADFATCFADKMSFFEFPHIYMSLPFEQYLNCSEPEEQVILRHLEFNADFGLKLPLCSIWSNDVNRGKELCHIGAPAPAQKFVPDSRTKRILFYALFDRQTLHQKIAQKARSLRSRLKRGVKK